MVNHCPFKRAMLEREHFIFCGISFYKIHHVSLGVQVSAEAASKCVQPFASVNQPLYCPLLALLAAVMIAAILNVYAIFTSGLTVPMGLAQSRFLLAVEK